MAGWSREVRAERLRMVETLLLREYDEQDVVTTSVENLDNFVGPETKLVSVHAHNPLGISYASAPVDQSVREHGLNMIDASQLTYLTAKAEAASAAGS